MILDARGNPVRVKKAKPTRPTGSCPKCGADKENIKPTLGGWIACMKCGHQSREKQDG